MNTNNKDGFDMEQKLKLKYYLSVVIPCYNSGDILINTLSRYEKYAINSIEFIIIDDKSTDESYSKLISYSKTSSLNLLIAQNNRNMGPGLSRNLGISLANGEYITFQDADDWFENSFFENVRSILDEHYDCVVFDFDIVNKSGKKTRNSIFYVPQKEGIVDVYTALAFIKGATCGKIYKTEIIRNHNIEFLSLKRNEDMPFTKISISHCNQIYYTNNLTYEYYQNENSLMHNKKLLNAQNALEAYNTVESKLLDSFPQEVYAIYVLECLYSTGQTNNHFLNRKEWQTFISVLEQNHQVSEKNKYVDQYPFSIRLIIKLIQERKYYILKLAVLAKKILKRIWYN